MPKIKAFVMSKPGFYIKIYTRSQIKTDVRTSTRPYTWNLLELGPTFIPIILQGHLLQDMHKSHEYKSTSTGSDKMKCSEKVVNFNILEI